MKVPRGSMSKPEYDDMLKQRFHEAQSRDAQVLALIDMADNDVWPDGKFGDADCNIWSAVHLIVAR